ncbi:MAG TPA: chaperone modulator CbpM [Roseiflexaceae bacterium]|jgi:DNA-binding transcriptional MerR regulator
MTNEQRRLNPEQAAAETQMDVRLVWRYANLGLITPSAAGYSDADLAELRRVRRLHEDLELDHSAIEIILRMRRQIAALQADIRRLELAVRAARRRPRPPNWVEAEWEDL